MANEGKEKAWERARRLERIAKSTWLRFYRRKMIYHFEGGEFIEMAAPMLGYYVGTKIKPVKRR